MKREDAPEHIRHGFDALKHKSFADAATAAGVQTKTLAQAWLAHCAGEDAAADHAAHAIVHNRPTAMPSPASRRLLGKDKKHGA